MVMTLLRSIALALPLLAAALASASAETLQGESSPAPTALALRNEVRIDGSLIRLGDLFDGPLLDANRPVAEAPAPGQSVTLDAGWLAALARAIALPWQPASRFDQVRVSRRGQSIEPGTVKVALMQALAERGLAGEVGIEFDGEDPHLVLPMGAEPTVAIERLTFDPVSGRFAAAIAAPATGPAEVTATISGRAYAMVEVPVLTRRMTPGDTIAEADIGWIGMPSDRVASGVVTELADLVGKTPRRPIRPQQPVRNTDLVDAIAVSKGALVTVALEGANMSLTVQGKALQNGAVGDTIRVVNTMSSRVLDAVVVSASRVAVMLPTSIAQGE
jgi:flagella basal body P-ring formation protein FlgA